MSNATSANHMTRPRVEAGGIPDNLKALRRWICWKQVKRDGKLTKVPCGPGGGSLAWTDQTTWMAFEEAHSSYVGNPGLAGIGVVLGDGLCGYDRDDCLDDAGLDDEGIEHIDRLNTYAEVSPSARGVKAFCYGPERLPDGKRGRNEVNDRTEWYTGGRWFAVTGVRLNAAPAEVRDAGAEFEALYRERYGAVEAPTATNRPAKVRRAIGGDSRVERYALAALAEECTAVSGTAAGARNARLNVAAFKLGQLVGAGVLGEHQVEEYLFSAAVECGLAEVESRKTIRSGLDAGKAEPRDLSNVGTDVRPRPSSNGKHPAEPPKADLEDAGPKLICNFTGSGDARCYLSADDLLHQIFATTGGWPKRTTDGLLFYPDKTPSGLQPGFLTSASQAFAYLARQAQTTWGRGESAISREIAYELLRQGAEAFDMIQAAPHWPPIRRCYYLHDPVPDGGSTGALDEFLDFYTFASKTDRELGRAFIATAYWGGPPSSRPAFVVTTEDEAAEGGVGAGKSTFSHAPALGRNGFTVSVSRSSDIDVIKARLLSTEGMRARLVALDNVKSMRLSSEDIESLVTERVISGKRMYVGEAAIPNLYTWVLTVNDPALSRDMARRSVPIRMGRARYTGDWTRRLESFLDRHRPDILRDIRHLLSAPTPMGYETRSRWATWEVEVLARCQTPEIARDRFMDAQDSLNEDVKEAEAVRDRFAAELAWLGGAAELDPSQIQACIPVAIAADWLNQALKKRWADNAASRRIKALKIAELALSHGRGGNSYIWTGGDWTDGNGTYHLRRGDRGQVTYTVKDVKDVKDGAPF